MVEQSGCPLVDLTAVPKAVKTAVPKAAKTAAHLANSKGMMMVHLSECLMVPKMVKHLG